MPSCRGARAGAGPYAAPTPGTHALVSGRTRWCRGARPCDRGARPWCTGHSAVLRKSSRARTFAEHRRPEPLAQDSAAEIDGSSPGLRSPAGLAQHAHEAVLGDDAGRPAVAGLGVEPRPGQRVVHVVAVEQRVRPRSSSCAPAARPAGVHKTKIGAGKGGARGEGAGKGARGTRVGSAALVVDRRLHPGSEVDDVDLQRREPVGDPAGEAARTAVVRPGMRPRRPGAGSAGGAPQQQADPGVAA